MKASVLQLDKLKQAEVWGRVIAAIEAYAADVEKCPVMRDANPEAIRSLVTSLDFEQCIDPVEAVDFVTQALRQYQVHTPHPRYFGLFNPAPTPIGVVADALVAAFNPQLAAWGHSPFAVEVEGHVLRMLASRFGYAPESTDGTFTSGGAEANHTALLTALVWKFPEFALWGLRGLNAQPAF